MLFVSGPVLEFVDDIPVPVLVSLTGDDHGVDHFLELLKSRAASDFFRMAGALTERFMPVITAVIQESKGASQGEEGQVIAGFVAKFMGEQRTIQTWLYSQLGAAVQGALAVADGIGALTFETLREKRTNIMTNLLHPTGYEEMLDGLVKLRLVEPRIQASLCGKCGDYAVSISNTPQAIPKCPKCGFNWATLTLFVFAQAVAPLKVDNRDLPLFVSGYIRSKVTSLMPLGNSQIWPLAEFGASDNRVGEVDVAIPDLRLGIECKEFEDALAPMTRSRLAGMAKDLEPQLARYMKLGFSRAMIVTNLSQKAAAKLAHALREKVPRLASREGALTVVPGTPELLLSALDSVANDISDVLKKEFTKRFKRAEGAALALPRPKPGKG
jgi:hypothetical protein